MGPSDVLCVNITIPTLSSVKIPVLKGVATAHVDTGVMTEFSVTVTMKLRNDGTTGNTHRTGDGFGTKRSFCKDCSLL
jgi:hypothetical protein